MKILHAIVCAGILGTGMAVAGTANAEPNGPSNVADLVRQLEEDDRAYIVNRRGTLPLSQCVVSHVRSGETGQMMAMTFGVDEAVEVVVISANCVEDIALEDARRDRDSLDAKEGRSISRDQSIS